MVMYIIKIHFFNGWVRFITKIIDNIIIVWKASA